MHPTPVGLPKSGGLILETRLSGSFYRLPPILPPIVRTHAREECTMTRPTIKGIPPQVRQLINRTAHELALQEEAAIRATLYAQEQAALEAGTSVKDAVLLVTTPGGPEKSGTHQPRKPHCFSRAEKKPFME